MTFGLSTLDFETLQQKVIEPLKRAGFQLFIFGSRATGKHHPFSDIDILVEPPPQADMHLFSVVKEDIQEARFPVKVDFVLVDQLAASYRARVHGEKVRV